MPVFKYFLIVGGALIALLFGANVVIPQGATGPAIQSSATDMPPIRIRSDRKLPERVVLDTSQPAVGSAAAGTVVALAPQPPVQTPPAASLAADAQARQSFAQLTAADAKHEPVVHKSEARSQVSSKPRRRVAVARAAPHRMPGRPMMIVAQQPHFGLFDNMW
jgi:hypothetical protein